MADDEDDFGSFETPDAVAPAPAPDTAISVDDDDDFGDLTIAPVQPGGVASLAPHVPFLVASSPPPPASQAATAPTVTDDISAHDGGVTGPIAAQDEDDFGPSCVALPPASDLNQQADDATVQVHELEPEAVDTVQVDAVQVGDGGDEFLAFEDSSTPAAAPVEVTTSTAVTSSDDLNLDAFGGGGDDFDAFEAPPPAAADVAPSPPSPAAAVEVQVASAVAVEVAHTTLHYTRVKALPRVAALPPLLPSRMDDDVLAILAAVQRALDAEPLEWSRDVPVKHVEVMPPALAQEVTVPPVDDAALTAFLQRIPDAAARQAGPTPIVRRVAASWKRSTEEEIRENSLPRPIRVAANNGKRQRAVVSAASVKPRATETGSKAAPPAPAPAPASAGMLSVSHLDALASMMGSSAPAPAAVPVPPAPAPAAPVANSSTPKVTPATAPVVPEPIKMSLAAFTQHAPAAAAPVMDAKPRSTAPAFAPAASRPPAAAPAPSATAGLSKEEVDAIADSIVSALEQRLPDLLTSLIQAASRR